MNWTEKE